MIRWTVRAEVRRALSAPALARLRLLAARMARAAALTERRRAFELSVLLCDDQEIHALNRAYRDKDRPTDVLAFAMREGPGGTLHPNLLGDVVISVETARRQARGTVGEELEVLFAHGLCHLLGYDHRTEAEEAEMNARQDALRREARRRGQVRAA